MDFNKIAKEVAEKYDYPLDELIEFFKETSKMFEVLDITEDEIKGTLKYLILISRSKEEQNDS
jgi:hypothetical protein